MMSSNTVFDRLKKIIVDQLGVDEADVVREAHFVDDLNADSLDLVDMIMTMEEKFKLTIPDADVEKIATVGDAQDYIEEHLR
jgi:acyl carrier protein